MAKIPANEKPASVECPCKGKEGDGTPPKPKPVVHRLLPGGAIGVDGVAYHPGDVVPDAVYAKLSDRLKTRCS